MPHQATASADDKQAHQIGIVLMLPKFAEDARHVLGGGVSDDRQILLGNVCRAISQNALNDGIVGEGAEFPHELLADGQHTLVGAELLGEHVGALRAAVGDEHDVHGAVADVADHVHAFERAELARHRREALGEDVRADEVNVELPALEHKVHVRLLEQVGLELLFLFAYPRQRQSRREIDRRGLQVPSIQLPPDGGEGEDEVVLIVLLFGDELLVSFSDDIEPPLVNQHIARKGRLGVVGGHTCPKARGCRLDVPISVIDADHDGGLGLELIFVYVHSVNLRFLM